MNTVATRIVWQAKQDPAIRQRILTPRRREVLVSIFSPVILLVAWEALVRAGLLDVRFFPAPSSIVGTFAAVTASGELWQHVYTSLSRIVIGFLMGAVPALLLGILFGLSRLARAFANPIIYALYPVPKVAILPLIMLIFGLGEMSKYVIIAIAVFFLVVLNTMAGVVQIDRIYFDVAKNFNASRRDFYFKVVLPGALPSIFTGLKLAMGVALIVLVTSEFVGARMGLGVMIFEAWQVFAIERLFVGLVVVSFLGYSLSLLIDELQRLLVPWQRDRA
jgi:ABC-type nitrate/sulfonate/bicarbonate transport system permease component